jgi:aminocarboxymuconate-semialdehyde decarboxylase
MKIDVHNHFYPNRFLDQLAKEGHTAGISIEKDEWKRTILVQGGARVVTITRPMQDIHERMEDMEKVGMDRQILTLSIPSVDIFPVKAAAELSRIVNDEFAKICQDHPLHFMAFATLPYLDPTVGIKELERCIDQLDFKGVCIGSNINGINLDDERLFPFYERMNDYNLPIHIHPRAPMDKKTYRDYRLGPMLGFEVDLSIAVVRLVMGGVLARYPNLKFIVSHLGGAIPYLAERIQNCYEAYPECQKNISIGPKEYLKQFYYDTVSFFEPALMCAYSFVGPEHMILGSDYPHVIGDIKEAIQSIENMPVPAKEKALIFSENILRLTHQVGSSQAIM